MRKVRRPLPEEALLTLGPASKVFLLFSSRLFLFDLDARCVEDVNPNAK